MRVLAPRLLAVLDPEVPTRNASAVSARATGADRSGRATLHASSAVSSAGAPTRTVSTTGLIAAPPASAGHRTFVGSSPATSSASPAVPPGEADESAIFDLLHTERGFVAFENWYRKLMAASPAATASPVPRPGSGLLWPQVFCPPGALHEYAFLELMKVFADCTDGELWDLFDLLDHEFRGMLTFSQVYFAVCIVAALGCRQLTKFLYFHSSRLFSMLAQGCLASTSPDRVTWARTVILLRLLGAPGQLIWKVAGERGLSEPLIELGYDVFLDVLFPIAVELDRGFDGTEITVINEHDRAAMVRSRMCTVL